MSLALNVIEQCVPGFDRSRRCACGRLWAYRCGTWSNNRVLCVGCYRRGGRRMVYKGKVL